MQLCCWRGTVAPLKLKAALNAIQIAEALIAAAR
jgi:hypothetical protein